MQTYPRRVPDDQTESSRRVRRAKVRRKGERKGATVRNTSPLAPKRRGTESFHAHDGLFLSTQLDSLAEQIRPTSSEQALAPRPGECGERTINRRQRAPAFLLSERAAQRCLSRAGGAHIALPEPHERGARTDEGRSLDERLARERISDANIAIEVRQRRNSSHPRLVVLDHDRQPESQFTQPDCGRILIHTMNGTREHVSAN